MEAAAAKTYLDIKGANAIVVDGAYKLVDFGKWGFLLQQYFKLSIFTYDPKKLL